MKRITTAAAIVCIACTVACGPDEQAPDVIPGDTNNTVSTNNGSDGGTNNDIDVVECAMQEEFSDQSVDVEREFGSSTDLDVISCADDVGEVATDGSYVARLMYSEATRVTIEVLGIATDGTPPRPAIEVRKGSCDGGEVVLCDSTASTELELEADTPYFVVVNGLLASGGVNLTITPESDGPCEPNELTCADGVAQLCTSTSTLREIPCAGGCEGDTCRGNNCIAPITVAPVAGGTPVAVEGNRITFSNTWTAEGLADCEVAEGQGSAPTPGPDFFLLVEGVEAGQTVVFDAVNANGRYGFFVIEDCAATSCLGAYEFDASSRNRGEYVAPADGDVLVVVEAFGDDLDRLFDIGVSIRE